ncbi:hypothetical protein WJX74_008299 [Apatococcus lobatus]|uniref:Uncharacterized protein n=1 Tax=Apatococcus lobatus TaxID=904363 RepID=A0AAW1R2F5_9CHLO
MKSPHKPGLACLFSAGVANIDTHRSNNLFEDLEKRALTEKEEKIIAERVKLQRDLLQQYEAREQQRKVKEVQEVCPDLTDSEAQFALSHHHRSEEATIHALVSSAAFYRKVKQHLGPAHAAQQQPAACSFTQQAVAAAPRRAAIPRARCGSAASAAQGGPQTAWQSSNIFVGAFRGRQFDATLGRYTTELVHAPAAAALVPLEELQLNHSPCGTTEPQQLPEAVPKKLRSSRKRRSSAQSAGDGRTGLLAPAVDDGKTSRAARKARREARQAQAHVAAVSPGRPDADSRVLEMCSIHAAAGLQTEGQRQDCIQPAAGSEGLLRLGQPMAEPAAHSCCSNDSGRMHHGAADQPAARSDGLGLQAHDGNVVVELAGERNTGNNTSAMQPMSGQHGNDAADNPTMFPAPLLHLASAPQGAEQMGKPQAAAEPAFLICGDDVAGDGPAVAIRDPARSLLEVLENVPGEQLLGYTALHPPPPAAEGDSQVSPGQSAQTPFQLAAAHSNPHPCLSAPAAACLAEISSTGHASDEQPVHTWTQPIPMQTGGGSGSQAEDKSKAAAAATSQSQAMSLVSQCPQDGPAMGLQQPVNTQSSANLTLNDPGHESVVAAEESGEAEPAEQMQQQSHEGDHPSTDSSKAASNRATVLPAAGTAVHVVVVADGETQPEDGQQSTHLISACMGQDLATAVQEVAASAASLQDHSKNHSSVDAADNAGKPWPDQGALQRRSSRAGAGKRSQPCFEDDVIAGSPKRQRVAAAGKSKKVKSVKTLPIKQPTIKAPAAGGSSIASEEAAALAAFALPNAPLHKPHYGRVKKSSSRQVKLVVLGTLRTGEGWFNKGYIFPEGMHTRIPFRSSVVLEQLCLHDCHILGQGGKFWPQPTFRIVAADQVSKPVEGRSATGAWNAILARINENINKRRRAGEDLPPPPKTALAGPEYFGLIHPDVIAKIELLDPEQSCTTYWAGKQERFAFGQVHGTAPEPKAPGQAKVAHARMASAGAGSGLSRRRGRPPKHGHDDDDVIYAVDGFGDEDGEGEGVGAHRWSAVNRAERARRRHGDESDAGKTDVDNPLPGVLDPITLEPIVRPAMSLYGHVMGLATWNAVIAEQGKCPFTQQSVRREQIVLLTHANIERHRDSMILP